MSSSLIHRVLSRIADVALKRDKDSWFWGYTIPDAFDLNKPYLTRILFPRILGFRPMLHYFHTPDEDRAQHNHPWKWAVSVILTGGYVEQRGFTYYVLGGWKRINILTHKDFHRVDRLLGYTWTLFIVGPRSQEWGFLVDGKVIHWQTYINQRRDAFFRRQAALKGESTHG